VPPAGIRFDSLFPTLISWLLLDLRPLSSDRGKRSLVRMGGLARFVYILAFVFFRIEGLIVYICEDLLSE